MALAWRGRSWRTERFTFSTILRPSISLVFVSSTSVEYQAVGGSCACAVPQVLETRWRRSGVRPLVRARMVPPRIIQAIEVAMKMKTMAAMRLIIEFSWAGQRPALHRLGAADSLACGVLYIT